MEGLEEQQGDVIILEEWGIIDWWWTDEPTRDYYREVVWNNRRITFRRNSPEKIWRIVRTKLL